VVVPAGLFGLARLQSLVVPGLGDPAALRPLLAGAAAATALVGGLLAVAQTHLKRLLACSSVAHTGIAAHRAGRPRAGARRDGRLRPRPTAPSSSGCSSPSGCCCTGSARSRWASCSTAPATARSRGRAARASAVRCWPGLPPSGLYAGKAIIADAATDAGLGWLGPVLYLAAGLTGVAVVRAAAHLWWGWPLAAGPRRAIGEGSQETFLGTDRDRFAFTAVPVVLVAASVGMTFVPGLLPGIATAAAHATTVELLAAALGLGPPAGSPVVPTLELWTATSLRWGLGAAGVALVGGLSAARHGRRPAPVPRPVRAVGVGFRRLHSGHVGDYTAWAMLGAGAWCAWALVASQRWT
jgi:multicomponent Na+:H+ antiporter subunit D